MNITTTILAVLIGLLSLAAGAAKITLVPEEAEFLQQFGFTDLLTICFGTVQVLGGILLFHPASRFYGAIVAALGFSLSAVLILITGNLIFTLTSTIPVVLAAFIIYRSINQPKRTSANLEAEP